MHADLTPNMLATLRLLATWNWHNEPVCWRPNKVAYRALRARGLVATKSAAFSQYNRHSGHTTFWNELGAWLTPAGRAECERLFGIAPVADYPRAAALRAPEPSRALTKF